MASTTRTTVRRCLGVLVAGAVVVTSLTAAPPRHRHRLQRNSRGHQPPPPYMLERGRFTPS